jgi:elongation factor Tu
VTVTLGKPVALEEGLGFAVREGNRTVAAGTVLSVIN